MNPIQQLLTALVFVALACPAGAGTRFPSPGIGGDVSHQQSSGQSEEEEEELEEEPDCD